MITTNLDIRIGDATPAHNTDQQDETEESQFTFGSHITSPLKKSYRNSPNSSNQTDGVERHVG